MNYKVRDKLYVVEWNSGFPFLRLLEVVEITEKFIKLDTNNGLAITASINSENLHRTENDAIDYIERCFISRVDTLRENSKLFCYDGKIREQVLRENKLKG